MPQRNVHVKLQNARKGPRFFSGSNRQIYTSYSVHRSGPNNIYIPLKD